MRRYTVLAGAAAALAITAAAAPALVRTVTSGRSSPAQDAPGNGGTVTPGQMTRMHEQMMRRYPQTQQMYDQMMGDHVDQMMGQGGH